MNVTTTTRIDAILSTMKPREGPELLRAVDLLFQDQDEADEWRQRILTWERFLDLQESADSPVL